MKKHEDKAMKLIAQNLGAAVVEFLNINKKIKEVGPTELTIASMEMDFTYLMEDGTYLHIEFQTTDKGVHDLRRFLLYDAKLSHDYQTDVYTCVIYSNEIKNPKTELSFGLSNYRIQPLSLIGLNSDDVFKSWQHKKLNHELISEKDLLLLLWTPLMSGQQSKFETLIKAANFLDEAPPQYDEKKDHLKSVLLLFADKFLSNIEIKKFKEVSSMAGFIKEIYDEGKVEGLIAGKTELLVNILKVKFSELPDSYIKQISMLPNELIDELGNHVFEIQKLEDLDPYLVH